MGAMDVSTLDDAWLGDTSLAVRKPYVIDRSYLTRTFEKADIPSAVFDERVSRYGVVEVWRLR